MLGGYVAAGSFLVDQAIWISVLLALLVMAINLADEFIRGTLRNQTRIATALQANTGFAANRWNRSASWRTVPPAWCSSSSPSCSRLPPGASRSADVMSSVRAAFFGFQVGDVHDLALDGDHRGPALRPRIRRDARRATLARHHLPAGDRTRRRPAQLDRHRLRVFRNFIAAAIAFSYLGLSLDRIAIVAGALSVGIGFGLQSIVNNFVSGLILLWGARSAWATSWWWATGSYVRRINVRATEIETFDRSTVVVPNSNLISGVVRNRVRSDRTGRVVVTVPVPRALGPGPGGGDHADLRPGAPGGHERAEPQGLLQEDRRYDPGFRPRLLRRRDRGGSRVSSDLMFAIYRRCAMPASGIRAGPRRS